MKLTDKQIAERVRGAYGIAKACNFQYMNGYQQIYYKMITDALGNILGEDK